MTDNLRASAPGRASGAQDDCWNSQASCADPHCVKHRGDRAIPLPPDRPATAEEVAASAERMRTKHAKSLEQLLADDTSDPVVRASGESQAMRDLEDFARGLQDVNLWNIVERLRAAALSSPSVAESPTWQPIATAPKDGTTVLGFTPFASVLIGDMFYSREQEQWERLPCEHVRPTHWMPMLSAPSPSAAAQPNTEKTC